MKLQREVPVPTANQRAIDLLSSATPELSKQQLKQAMEKGALWLQQGKKQKRLRRVTFAPPAKSLLRLFYDDTLLSKSAPTATLVADEGQYSVWDKPAGMLAQGTLWGDHCSLMYIAEKHFTPRRQTFLVHRLDSAASGLMLIAHTGRAAASLSALFQSRDLKKNYRVVITGEVKPQIIDQPLDGKEAISVIESATPLVDKRTELTIRIETGRKHQIRRHLASLGHPVIGDREYGSEITNEPLQLRAVGLEFICPITRKRKSYQAP